jgi:23S rRNA pseudouridine2457 synthase
MTLKDYVDVPGVYAAGRLDADSEGLVVLTDDGRLQAAISHPKHKARKIYWVQVEGIPDEARLAQLRAGVDLGDFVTKPCLAGHLEPPSWLWARDPPIRYRASIPTSWLEVQLTEGKNRQVRRMTAKVGHPTLRLVRWAVGEWTLSGLKPGEWREIRYAAPAVNQSRRGRVMGND